MSYAFAYCSIRSIMHNSFLFLPNAQAPSELAASSTGAEESGGGGGGQGLEAIEEEEEEEEDEVEELEGELEDVTPKLTIPVVPQMGWNTLIPQEQWAEGWRVHLSGNRSSQRWKRQPFYTCGVKADGRSDLKTWNPPWKVCAHVVRVCAHVEGGVCARWKVLRRHGRHVVGATVDLQGRQRRIRFRIEDEERVDQTVREEAEEFGPAGRRCPRYARHPAHERRIRRPRAGD